MKSPLSPKHTLRLRALRSAVVLAIFSSSVMSLLAAPPPGRLLASMCYQCHGTNGQAVAGFESVSGKNAGEMFKTLREMKNRRAETIMDIQARGFTDAQLRQIADYLATLPASADE